MHRDPHLVELLERDPERLDRSLEHGRVGHVELEALVAEQLTGCSCFGHTELAQRNIDPAREAVLEVPLTLAVSQEDELVHVWVIDAFGPSVQSEKPGKSSRMKPRG